MTEIHKFKDPVCFYCKLWQPDTEINSQKRMKAIFTANPYSEPGIYGSCKAVATGDAYISIRKHPTAIYAPVEATHQHTTNAQNICDIYFKQDTFLLIFGGKMKRAYKPIR